MSSLTVKRGILTALAIVVLVGTAVLAVTDTKADGTNCGSAISPRDTSQSLVLSGNTEQDNFAQQSLVDRCDRLIFRQRFLVFGGLLVVAGFFGGRALVRREPQRFAGDSII